MKTKLDTTRVRTCRSLGWSRVSKFGSPLFFLPLCRLFSQTLKFLLPFLPVLSMTLTTRESQTSSSLTPVSIFPHFTDTNSSLPTPSSIAWDKALWHPSPPPPFPPHLKAIAFQMFPPTSCTSHFRQLDARQEVFRYKVNPVLKAGSTWLLITHKTFSNNWKLGYTFSRHAHNLGNCAVSLVTIILIITQKVGL